MSFKLIKSEHYKTSHWAGGSTTEIMIYPPEATLKEKNFKFRLSTATVEVEQSTFTKLEGVSRILMVLEGNIMLHHEGHHYKALMPFECDNFEGAWDTLCIGKCADFNLMTTTKTKGTLKHICLAKGNSWMYQKPLEVSEVSMVVVYIFAGEFEILPSKTRLREKDSFSTQENMSEIFALSNCDLVLAEITF